MKKWMPLVGCITIGLIGCKCSAPEEETFTYPYTAADSTHSNYFGTAVEDPYQWLEYMKSDSTKSWIARQNQFSEAYFSKIPYITTLSNRFREVWNYTRYSMPFREGKETYYYKNSGLQQHSVLYRKTGQSQDEVFLDPNTFSKDGSTSLADLSFSSDGQLLAYSISEGGSDWRKVIIIDVHSRQQIGDTLRDIKFSNIAWALDDSGVYYSTYADVANPLRDKTSHHTVYYHKLNTSQRGDPVIMGGFRYMQAYTSEDKKYLIIEGANSTHGNALFLKKLSAPFSTPIPVITDDENENHVIYSQGDDFWLYTDYGAPNGQLVKVRLKNGKFNPSSWKAIIPESDMPLTVSIGSNALFAHYLKDATSLVKQYRLDGKLDYEVALPAVGTVNGFEGNKDDSVLYFNFTNYTTERSIFEYSPVTGKSKLYKSPSINYSPDDYVSEQLFYLSKDSTKIPMIISYKKGMRKDGKNPLLLYGYGGFNISLTPRFSVSNLIWMERGGIFAVPNLRGGGEYGQRWHQAGIQMNKQNVFDDFIAAAEYLIAEKYTSTPYLAIEGRSNGGLLVGACMTQRPDLFRVALPIVGVLDMVKYHRFTAGAGWAYDYGTAADSKPMFEYLLSYSPVHNVLDTCYPATLVMTGDHDDRVVPAHSYKFIAQLQVHQQCNKPTLIAVATKAGHGAGKPIDVRIEEQARKWAFAWWNMGFKKLPQANQESDEGKTGL